MPEKRANVKNEKQYEALKDKGMSKERAAKIANSPKASKHGGKKSGSGGDSRRVARRRRRRPPAARAARPRPRRNPEQAPRRRAVRAADGRPRGRARGRRGCRGCELWRPATQTVFGEGPPDPEIVLVGEQPGDREDREGHPFVGPAGHVLDVALERAGLDGARIYKTNAVKHFRFKERGKRRLHEPPLRSHVVACQPWLRAELEILAPPLLVLLGAVAAQSLLGRDFKVTAQRGLVSEPPDGLPTVIATVHPSSILRAPEEDRSARMDEFVADLELAARRGSVNRTTPSAATTAILTGY